MTVKPEERYEKPPVDDVLPLDHWFQDRRLIGKCVAPIAHHPVASSHLSVSEGPRGKAFCTVCVAFHMVSTGSVTLLRHGIIRPPVLPYVWRGKNRESPPSSIRLWKQKNLELHNDLQIGKPYPNELLPLVEHARTFMDIPVPDSGIERAHTRDFFDEGVAGDGKCHTSCYAVG